MDEPPSIPNIDNGHPNSQTPQPENNPSPKNDDDQEEKYGHLLDLNGNEFQIPTYTMQQIHAAIPKDCFERNTLTSLRYLIQDLSLITGTFYLSQTLITPSHIPLLPVRILLWTYYTFLQGVFGSGLWVLAHECGHQAFSPSKTLNDTLGFLIHNAMLVPYFSFKIVHRNHHKHNANMWRDTSLVPETRAAYAERNGESLESVVEYAEDTPMYSFFCLLVQQTVGWPVVMGSMMGVGEGWWEKRARARGVEKPERNEDGTIKRKLDLGDSQLNPFGPLFETLDAKLIVLSDVGLLVMFYILYALAQRFGWMNMFVWYGIPYLWINYWLFLVTYLHHHDATLPRYNPSTWTFARGAAATIDRDFGWGDKYFAHHIVGTHVLHHHVSTIPHYHAERASEAIKPVMGAHYKSDLRRSGMWNYTTTFWRLRKRLSWVEPSEGAVGEGRDVLFFRNRIGVGVPPAGVKK